MPKGGAAGAGGAQGGWSGLVRGPASAAAMVALCVLGRGREEGPARIRPRDQMGAVEPARELRLKHCSKYQERSLVHSAKATRARRCTRISIQKGQATRLGPTALFPLTIQIAWVRGCAASACPILVLARPLTRSGVPARPPTAVAVLYAPAVTRATDTLRTTARPDGSIAPHRHGDRLV